MKIFGSLNIIGMLLEQTKLAPMCRLTPFSMLLFGYEGKVSICETIIFWKLGSIPMLSLEEPIVVELNEQRFGQSIKDLSPSKIRTLLHLQLV